MPRLTPIAIAVVEHEAHVLIGQRKPGSDLAGLWEFPGGKIEKGESPQIAAVRECREETGLDVEVSGELSRAVFHYEHASVELHFFSCEVLVDGQPSVKHPFFWVRRDELSSYQFPEGNEHVLEVLAIK